MSDWTALSATVINVLMTIATSTMAYMTWRAVQLQRDQMIQAHSPRFFLTSEYTGPGSLPNFRLHNKGLGPAYDVAVIVQDALTGTEKEALKIEYWPTQPEVQDDFNAPDSYCISGNLVSSLVEKAGGCKTAQTRFSVGVIVHYVDRLFRKHSVSCAVRLRWEPGENAWKVEYPNGHGLRS